MPELNPAVSIDAKTLLALRREACAQSSVSIASSVLDTLIDAYMERAAMLLLEHEGDAATDECAACGHLRAEHGPAGCAVRLDSAWTPDNTKPCGCRAFTRPPPAPSEATDTTCPACGEDRPNPEKPCPNFECRRLPESMVRALAPSEPSGNIHLGRRVVASTGPEKPGDVVMVKLRESEASILRCPQCGVDPSGPTMGEAVELLRELEAVGRDSFWQRRCLFCHGHVAYGKVVHDPTCRLGTFLQRCGVPHE